MDSIHRNIFSLEKANYLYCLDRCILEKKPDFIKSKYIFFLFKMHNEEMKGFVDKVGGHIQTLYPDVSKMISKNYVPAKGN